MLTADSHLDLGWSSLHWNRDLKLPLGEIRRMELDLTPDATSAGNNTVCLPAMSEANLFLSLTTVLTGRRLVKPVEARPGCRLSKTA